MTYVALAFGLAALSGIGLVCVRRYCQPRDDARLVGRGDGGHDDRLVRLAGRDVARSTLIAGAVGGYGVGFGLACVVLAGLSMADMPVDMSDGTLTSYALLGAFAGIFLFLVVRLLVIALGTSLWRWGCRMPVEMERTWGEVLATTSLAATGSGLVGSLLMVGAHTLETHSLAMWLLPFLVCLYPLYETFVLPWFQYARAPTLESERLTELDTWVKKVCRERALPSIRVRIQKGAFTSAFAVGGIGAHLIVLGKGLVTQLAATEVQAVTAHELAHAARRDLVRLIPVTAVAGALHTVCVMHVSHPLFATDQVWGVAAGALLAGVFAAVFILFVPGFFMRRMEFAADRLAAELLGDGEPLAQALERLCEISGQPLTQRSWSHPTMQARIEALRSLAAEATRTGHGRPSQAS